MTMGPRYRNTLWVTFVCVLMTSIKVSQSANLLLVPFDHAGHTNFFIIAAQALKTKGHNVTVFTDIRYRSAVENAGLRSLTWRPVKAISIHDDKEITEAFSRMSFRRAVPPKETFQTASKIVTRMSEQCIEILENKDLQRNIRDSAFDLAIMDGHFLMKSFYIIPYKHSIKFVTLMVIVEPWSFRVPSLPSVEPNPLLDSTNDIPFTKRIKNLVLYIALPFSLSFVEPGHLVSTYAPDRPQKTISGIYSSAEMVLVNWEIYALDYPRISAPHYRFIGGLGAKPPKPLPEDLDDFAANATDLVLVSFGSMVKVLPEWLLAKLFSVFSKIPHIQFIMKLGNDFPGEVPCNVKTMKWLPQNDLLGHPKVRAFITHGGNNGQLEALYHGVPMISAPVFNDQVHNAMRIQKRGYGKFLFMAESNVEEIMKAVLEVVTNDSYRENIKRGSEILRSLPKAKDTLVFWIDHILRFGSDHIKSPHIDMPLYKLFMFDVFFFLGTIALCIIILVIVSIRYGFMYFCKRNAKEKRKMKSE